MSVWLCFFNKQDIPSLPTPKDSASTQVSCELLPNECKFELSKLKLLKNKLLPEARKRLRSIQSELNALSKPRSIIAARVECLLKIQVIFVFLGITFGGYILAVGEGMALLVTTVLISIGIYLMSLFMWHWNISGFQRDIESLFVKENEKHSQSLQLNWKVLPNCQAIVVSYDYHGSTKRQEKGEENKQSEELRTQEEEVVIEINDLEGYPRKNDRQKSLVKQNYAKPEKDNKEQMLQKSEVVLPTGASEENNTNQDFQLTTEGNEADHRQQKQNIVPSGFAQSPHGFTFRKEQFQDTYLASSSVQRKEEVDELTPPDSPEIQTLEDEMSEKPALKRNSLLGKRDSQVSAKRASLMQNTQKRESLKKHLQQIKPAGGGDEEESMELGDENEDDEEESHQVGRTSNEEQQQDKEHGTEEVAEINEQLESEITNPMTSSKESNNLMEKQLRQQQQQF